MKLIAEATINSRRGVVAKELEGAHSQIRYQTDLALRTKLAMRESEMHANHAHQEGRVQYQEFN